MIEFLPWYSSNQQLVRCLACGALVNSGDTALHTDWHERLEPAQLQRRVWKSCAEAGCTMNPCRLVHYRIE